MKKALGIILILMLIGIVVHAQQSKDSVLSRLTALRDDYVGKIKAMGYNPRLPLPPIVLTNPRSFGNYDDSLNVIQTCYWPTLPDEQRAVFINFAEHVDKTMTGEQFFN
jgi:hypothetical protein